VKIKLDTIKLIFLSVQALKKKYVEQRLARSVATNSMRNVTTSKANGKSSVATSKGLEGVRTRSAQKLRPRRSVATSVAKKSGVKVTATIRKPSAAAIIAKRKTKMATLTAASSRVSR